MSTPPRFATRCVHAGDSADAHGAAHGPVYTTTTFAFDSTAALRAAGAARRPSYTREGRNPTIFAVERQLAALEEAEAALVFSAGMAAISATCLALGRNGVVGYGNLYGGTWKLLTRQLPALGIATRLVPADNPEALAAALAGGPGLLVVETPGNPDLAVHDLRALGEKARAAGVRMVVDNTFASPVNQRPLGLGADLVVHSATKYLGGHSDLTAGAAMATRDLVDELDGWRSQLGQTPAPETAALLARSLRTLAVRVERHNATAARVAAAMDAHPMIDRVLYPGLPSMPGHNVALRQMAGFGGMLAIEVAGSVDNATAMVDNLKLFLNAPSLGGVESLATLPAVTSHVDLAPEERERRGIRDNLVRLSIGLEDADDLIDDLNQALAASRHR